MNVDFKLLLIHENSAIMSKGKYQLLKEVEKEGSLNSAAKSLGLSYKKAFSYIKSIEVTLNEPVLIRTPGKSAVLSPKGIELIEMYDFFYKEISVFIKEKLNEYENKK
jgi:molybdate transport system regulatory protein